MPVGIRVIEVKDVHDATVYLATLKSRTSSNVSPEVAGQITRIYVRPGDRVAAGAALVQIDPLKQQASVSNYEKQYIAQSASLRFASQQLERTRHLAAAGVASEQELEEAQAGHDVAKASLESLAAQVKEQQEQLRYYKVTAPTSGIVGDIPVRVGDRVTSATVLTTLDRPHGLEAYIQVPIERAPLVRYGLPVELLDARGNVVCATRVSFISPEVANDTQSVLVTAPASCPGQDRRTSEYVRARVIWGTTPLPLVPVLAVSRVNGQPFVFVAKRHNEAIVARQVAVRLGETVGNEYAVLHGVGTGDQLIVTGTQILADGMPVQPVK
jgi:RND family efflux transporter MFP subunit